MKRLLKLGFAALALVVFGRATCGPQPKVAGVTVTPVQKLEFTDHVYYHNMGITWDGEYYYTVNGGNTENSNLNKYDESGELDAEYSIGADGRAILYSPSEEQLYVKTYGLSLDEVDLDLEETDTALEDVFSGEQSSVAMSPDGEKLYELYEGTVNVFNTDGDEETTYELSSYNTTEELGYANSIAASDKFLFVWAPDSDKEILVYGIDGKYITRFELPRSGYGFSLSWANDMLWIAEDADGSSDGADGTWYGYELKGLE
jgi:DNA-binding beta-propeller fold protein YncE